PGEPARSSEDGASGDHRCRVRADSDGSFPRTARSPGEARGRRLERYSGDILRAMDLPFLRLLVVRSHMKSLPYVLFFIAAVIGVPASLAQHALDSAKLDAALGRSGQWTGEVYRYGFPRSDLHVRLNGLALKPGLALASVA